MGLIEKVIVKDVLRREHDVEFQQVILVTLRRININISKYNTNTNSTHVI